MRSKPAWSDARERVDNPAPVTAACAARPAQPAGDRLAVARVALCRRARAELRRSRTRASVEQEIVVRGRSPRCESPRARAASHGAGCGPAPARRRRERAKFAREEAVQAEGAERSRRSFLDDQCHRAARQRLRQRGGSVETGAGACRAFSSPPCRRRERSRSWLRRVSAFENVLITMTPSSRSPAAVSPQYS